MRSSYEKDVTIVTDKETAAQVNGHSVEVSRRSYTTEFTPAENERLDLMYEELVPPVSQKVSQTVAESNGSDGNNQNAGSQKCPVFRIEMT